MNRSGTIFVAALNGSALGLGAELAWACDLRVMANGDCFIGQPEVLSGIMMADRSKDGQELMRDYLATADATGELPFYDPDTYARALGSGRLPGRRATNGR